MSVKTEDMYRRLIVVLALALAATTASADVFNKIPNAWKWTSAKEVAFTYDYTFVDDGAFIVNARNHKVTTGIKAPAKFATFPVQPEGAVNLTYSPDSTKLAFTRDNDLYVVDIASGRETRLTSDGTDLILNGYASWVYYEEILGRPSRYRAFWWSPDSKKIGFYRFDNSKVPMFPIYSPFGQDGSLSRTRYPKSGEPNPEVRIGITDLEGNTVWADFDEKDDQYFGIPFWGADSKQFYIAREPRIQNTLDLFAVSAEDGSKTHVYHEEYKTWLDWIEEVIFTEKGLYMARSFETGWQQIYFLSYDGKTFNRLTDGPNWRISLVRVDEAAGDVYFIANRDSDIRKTLYKVDKKGVVTALTDPAYNTSLVSFSPDGKYFVASLSNYVTPNQVWLYDKNGQKGFKVADMKGDDYDPANFCLAQEVRLAMEDGQVEPAAITYPRNFDPSKKYPVHVNLYGGPDNPSVNERWQNQPADGSNWFADNGIINITIDSRAAGHTGRAGTDLVFRNVTAVPVADFVTWAKWLQSLPYVQPDKIGVEGFSFGGTMTSLLLLEHSDAFHYGIAGGGVYDWMLYDTHYTERFMETPQANPEGFKEASVINHVDSYPMKNGASDGSVMLKITHGTGDDNVHFQNTMQLIDKLQERNYDFQLMIYPDGMHGYRGYQGMHSNSADRDFWTKYLLGR